jgi:hypothetical protein
MQLMPPVTLSPRRPSLFLPSPSINWRRIPPSLPPGAPSLSLTLLTLLLAHAVAGVRGASPELVPRRSLLDRPFSLVEFIPAHEREPKVEDKPKLLIFF